MITFIGVDLKPFKPGFSVLLDVSLTLNGGTIRHLSAMF